MSNKIIWINNSLQSSRATVIRPVPTDSDLPAVQIVLIPFTMAMYFSTIELSLSFIDL